MTDRISNKIYETKNYAKFIPFKGNRGSTTAHVKKLAESMKAHGWIDSLPMSVKKESNGRFKVVDGHNRLAAAEMTGTPAKYSVINGEVCEDDVYLINRTQRRWTTLDYIKSYARMGYPEYETVIEFIEKHKCGAPIACALLANQPTVATSIIQEGRFKVFDKDWAEEMIGWLRQMDSLLKCSVFKTVPMRVFVKACNVKKFDPSRFMAQLAKRPHLYVEYTREHDMAQMMEEIYNFGATKRNRIPLAFMIQQV